MKFKIYDPFEKVKDGNTGEIKPLYDHISDAIKGENLMSGGINPPKKIKGHGAKVFIVEITQFEDGYVELRGGMPTSFDVAIGLMFAGVRVVCNKFLKCAKENKLNDQNVIDGSRIVVAKPGANLN